MNPSVRVLARLTCVGVAFGLLACESPVQFDPSDSAVDGSVRDAAPDVAEADSGPSFDAEIGDAADRVDADSAAEDPAPCTIFVSVDGSDDASGRLVTEALRSPSSAVELAGPGDVVCFAPGTYVGTDSRRGALHIEGKHGEPDRPVVFRSADLSPRAVFSLGDTSAGGRVSAIFLQRSSHIVIENLEATDALRGLTGNGVHHVTVTGCYIHHVGGELVFFGKSAGRVDLSNPASHTIVIEDNEIAHSGLAGGFGEGIYIATSVESAQDDTHNVRIERNHIHHVVDEAIDIKTGGHTIEILDNTIHDVDLNSQAAITVAIHGYNWNPGRYVIRGNRIARVSTHGPEGVGIWVGHGDAEITDNVIWDVADWGVYLPSTFNLTDHNRVTLRRNTIWNTGRKSVEWGRTWSGVPNYPAQVDMDATNETWDGEGDSTRISSCEVCGPA